MERLILGQGVLVNENQLITRMTPWYVQHSGIIPQTVHVTLVVEVHQIHKQLVTSGADETLWMPQDLE